MFVYVALALALKNSSNTYALAKLLCTICQLCLFLMIAGAYSPTLSSPKNQISGNNSFNCRNAINVSFPSKKNPAMQQTVNVIAHKLIKSTSQESTQFWQTNPLDEYTVAKIQFSLNNRILFEIKIEKKIY